MGKFRLRLKVYSFAYLDVEADNEEEARKQKNSSADVVVYDGGYRELMGIDKLKK